MKKHDWQERDAGNDGAALAHHLNNLKDDGVLFCRFHGMEFAMMKKADYEKLVKAASSDAAGDHSG